MALSPFFMHIEEWGTQLKHGLELSGLTIRPKNRRLAIWPKFADWVADTTFTDYRVGVRRYRGIEPRDVFEGVIHVFSDKH